MLSCLMTYLRSFLMPLRDERGQTLAEYELVVVVIAIACIGALVLFASQLQTMWNWIVGQVIAVL